MNRDYNCGLTRLWKRDLSNELQKLLRKNATSAIGSITHTEIFVNLQEALLAGGGLQNLTFNWRFSEKPCCGRFNATIRERGWNAPIFIPDIGVRSEAHWDKHIHQHFGDSRVTYQCHAF